MRQASYFFSRDFPIGRLTLLISVVLYSKAVNRDEEGPTLRQVLLRNTLSARVNIYSHREIWATLRKFWLYFVVIWNFLSRPIFYYENCHIRAYFDDKQMSSFCVHGKSCDYSTHIDGVNCVDKFLSSVLNIPTFRHVNL